MSRTPHPVDDSSSLLTPVDPFYPVVPSPSTNLPVCGIRGRWTEVLGGKGCAEKKIPFQKGRPLTDSVVSDRSENHVSVLPIETLAPKVGVVRHEVQLRRDAPHLVSTVQWSRAVDGGPDEENKGEGEGCRRWTENEKGVGVKGSEDNFPHWVKRTKK